LLTFFHRRKSAKLFGWRESRSGGDRWPTRVGRATVASTQAILQAPRKRPI